MQLTGFHHLTAVTADASRNHAFYTKTLGLRLVKKTVHQDDVSAYHLFYADGEATPGTDITFFDWPVGREKRGANSIVRTGLRLPGETSLHWWAERFEQLSVMHSPAAVRDGRNTIDFEDWEGQRLSLVVDGFGGESHPWARSSVPTEHQIRGLGPITICVADLRRTDVVLTNVMNMRRVREYQVKSEGAGSAVHVYQMGADPPAGSGQVSPATELYVKVEPGSQPAGPGAGGVHHVAFRTPTIEAYRGWIERLGELGMPSSGPVDRYYFRSLYFREPNGILFEIATDGPGFAADESLDALGEKLALPPFLETRRLAIEAGLKSLATS
jgi:glyoxalase family protein